MRILFFIFIRPSRVDQAGRDFNFREPVRPSAIKYLSTNRKATGPLNLIMALREVPSGVEMAIMVSMTILFHVDPFNDLLFDDPEQGAGEPEKGQPGRDVIEKEQKDDRHKSEHFLLGAGLGVR